ncbi:MAG: hypothetical protein PHV42_00285 [Candidatus Pacebacteria bacterium]|nr:hypothetical protein [Candidatus Paceibacterota bacterium]
MDFDPLVHNISCVIREAKGYGQPATVKELLALKARSLTLRALTSQTNPLSKLPALGTPLEDGDIVPGISKIPRTKYWGLAPIRAQEWLSCANQLLIAVVLQRTELE